MAPWYASGFARFLLLRCTPWMKEHCGVMIPNQSTFSSSKTIARNTHISPPTFPLLVSLGRMGLSASLSSLTRDPKRGPRSSRSCTLCSAKSQSDRGRMGWELHPRSTNFHRPLRSGMTFVSRKQMGICAPFLASAKLSRAGDTFNPHFAPLDPPPPSPIRDSGTFLRSLQPVSRRRLQVRGARGARSLIFGPWR